MRVLYDGDMLTRQRAGGVNRYFAELIGGLPAEWSPVLFLAERHALSTVSHPRLDVRFWQRYGFRPGRLSYWLEKHYFRLAETKVDADVAHPTTYRLLTRHGLDRYLCPVVVTVWDMIHERFAAAMDPDGQVAERKRRAVLAADRVICISETTRRDLLEHVDVPPERVVVTPLAASLAPPSSEAAPVEGRPYLLHVGSRAAGYKNFDGLLRAFARVVTEHDDLELRIVGAPLDADERRLVDSLGVEPRVRLEARVDDVRLATLYRDCRAFVYPSHYEGFGIPPLEAMRCGAPVVASRGGSIPEVVGDAAELFSPGEDDDTVAALLRVLGDEAHRAGLLRRGAERASAFSWSLTVAATLDVYRSVAR